MPRTVAPYRPDPPPLRSEAQRPGSWVLMWLLIFLRLTLTQVPCEVLLAQALNSEVGDLTSCPLVRKPRSLSFDLTGILPCAEATTLCPLTLPPLPFFEPQSHVAQRPTPCPLVASPGDGPQGFLHAGHMFTHLSYSPRTELS